MQNITRSLTEFSIKAYDVKINDSEQAEIEVVAECNSLATSMTRAQARAELAEATGKKLPKGITIKWTPVTVTTYALPLDKFVEIASVLKIETVEN